MFINRRIKYDKYIADISIHFVSVLLLIVLCFTVKELSADEIGLATGLNISTYKSWNSESAEFQMIDYICPVEVYYQKHLFKFISIRPSLKYNRLSISSKVKMTKLDGSTVVSLGYSEYKSINNYISFEIAPQFSYGINKLVFDLRTGFSCDLYINEYSDFFGDRSGIKTNKNKYPAVFSFVSGVGVGYKITEMIKSGFSSCIKRTISDIDKINDSDTGVYFINFHNVIYTSYTF